MIMPEFHKFLIEFYPINPNEYFHVYNIDLLIEWFNDPEADLPDNLKGHTSKDAFDSFLAVCSRLYGPRLKWDPIVDEETIIFYNDSAWVVVSAETVKGAIEKFWDILSRRYLSPGEV